MEGGTTFHFVTDGIESALRQAREAADGADVRIGGGAQVVSIPAPGRGPGGRHDHHPIFPLSLLAASTGLRRSERLGLRWQDVDLAVPVCSSAALFDPTGS